MPTRLHVVRGSYRRDRHGGKMDAPPLVDPPTPPAWLDDEGKAEWARVAPELVELGVLTRLDVAALGAYCAAVATWKAASAVVAAEGMTVEGRQGVVTHPAVRVARNAEASVLAWAREFGLTPASRSRLGVSMPASSAGQNDPDRFFTSPS